MIRRAYLSIFLWLSLFVPLSAQQAYSPKAAAPSYQAGQQYMQHAHTGGAFEEFKQAMTQEKDMLLRTASNYYRDFLAVRLSYLHAEENLNAFIEKNPINTKTHIANFELGNLYYAEKDFEKASQYYEKVDLPGLSQEEQQTARFRWGYALFNQRRLEPALEKFEPLKLSPNQYAHAANYYAGFIEYVQKKYEQALEDFLRIEKTTSYETVVPYMIAQTYFKLKKYDKTLQYINGLVNNNNKQELDLLVAECYYQKKEFDKALTQYETYLQTDGKMKEVPSVLMRAGHAAYLLKKNDLAIQYLSKAAVEKDSVGIFSTYYLSMAYLKNKQPDLAIAPLRAVKNQDKFPALSEESSYLYALASLDMGKYEQAMGELEFFVKKYPQSARLKSAKEALSRAYIDANNYNKAVAYIESLSERSDAINKSYQKAAMFQGENLYNAEAYSEAIEAFKKSLKYPLSPLYAVEASYWCAEAYAVQKKYQEAIPYYQRVLQYAQGEQALNACYGIGYAYFALGKYDHALPYFQKYASENKTANGNPATGDVLTRLADCYYIQKDYAKALQYYEQSTKSNSPEKNYALLQQGIILGIQRKYEEAKEKFDAIIKSPIKSSWYEDALYEKAKLNFEQGNYAVAANDFDNIIKKNESSKYTPYAYYKKAVSEYNLKNYSLASDDYITLLKNYPTHPIAKDAIIALQETLTLSNRAQEFDGYVEKLKSYNTNISGLDKLKFETGKNFYFNQDYEQAIKSLQLFLQNNPDSPYATEAKYYLAESCYRKKNMQEALTYYRQLLSQKTSPLYTKIVARLAEIELKNENSSNAISAFKELEARATNKKEQYAAWTGLMESYFMTKQYDSTITFANLIVEKASLNPAYVNKAMLYIAKAQLAKKNVSLAQDALLQVANISKDEYGAEAKYLLAKEFYNNKKNKLCYQTLLSLTKDFVMYTQWTGKAYLLMADNFIATNDLLQAEATLQSLNQFPITEIKEQAEQKLMEVEMLKQARKKRQEATDTIIDR